MTGGGSRDRRDHGAVGGPARHVPVLREEALRALDLRPGLYLDCTFGGGGYTNAILSATDTKVLALDRDPAAIQAGAKLVENVGDRLTLKKACFADLEVIAAGEKLGSFDGIVFDIGVSSMQLDDAQRGFSFRQDGPLDMRMSHDGLSAADIVRDSSEEALADVLFHYGEERFARRIARAIVTDRKTSPFLTTRTLADLVARILPRKPTDIHPATRTFQALRIAVNNELGELVSGLAAAERMLKPGGRLVVITFHSLEDRIAKLFFAKRSGRGAAAGRRLPGEALAIQPSFICPRRQPVLPSDAETQDNPRARSAKLRFGIRTSSAPLAVEALLLRLAVLPGKSR